MAAIVCRAPRFRMRGDVLEGRGPIGGASRRSARGVSAAVGTGPGRPRVGVARSTGMASATRPRMARGGGPAGGALAPFMGGTSAFALPFPTAPRLRAIVGGPVCHEPPGACQEGGGLGNAPSLRRNAVGAANPSRNQANQGKQPENYRNDNHDPEHLLNRRVERQERLDQVENQANDDKHDDQLN